MEGNENVLGGFPLSEREQKGIVVANSAIQELCNKLGGASGSSKEA
jgi:hypothetical protein